MNKKPSPPPRKSNSNGNIKLDDSNKSGNNSPKSISPTSTIKKVDEDINKQVEKVEEEDDDYKILDVPQQSNLPPINLKSQTTRESMVVSKQIIGSYVIGELVGKGGFASVFKGLNTVNGDFVAIKRFNKSRISKEQLASVSTELELLQKLNHESIVRILSKDENEDYVFLFLEFMENGSLSSILNQYGTFPEPLLANYMENVLRGLVYLHSENVIHRDIKAANILINKVGDAKLSDFGVAGEIQESDKRYSVVGTPYWMAPEVIEMSGQSQSSDIWSIGCTTVELLTGSPPYFHLNPMSAMFRIVQDDKPAFPKNISKELYDFLDRCFVKSIEERATAKELLHHPWISKNKIIVNQQKVNSLSFRSTQPSPNTLDQISKTISTFNEQQKLGIKRSSSDLGSSDLLDDNLSESSVSSSQRSSVTLDDENGSNGKSSPSGVSSPNHKNQQINQQNELEIKKLSSENSLLKLKIKELENEAKSSTEKLNESERKYKEILLSSMHYIYIVDSTINLSSTKQSISNDVTHLRNIMRDQIESEYYNAYPEENMVPRFIQRRLTRDTLIHIPKKALEAQKRREKEEKKKLEKKEKEEKKEKDRLDKEKLDKDKRSLSFNNNINNNLNNGSTFSPSKSNDLIKSSLIGSRRTNSKNSITSEISAQMIANVKLTPVNSPIKDLNKDLSNSTPSSPNRK